MTENNFKIITEEKLPWNYLKRLLEFLKPHTNLLVMGIEDEKFTLSLGHDFSLTSVTCDTEKNFAKLLQKYGATVKQKSKKLDFEDESFDLILNYHADYDIGEVRRVLKNGGHFITEQIGARDCEEQNGYKLSKDITFNLENQATEFKKANFKLVYRNQAYPLVVESDGENSREYKKHRFIVVAKKLK